MHQHRSNVMSVKITMRKCRTWYKCTTHTHTHTHTRATVILNRRAGRFGASGIYWKRSGSRYNTKLEYRLQNWERDTIQIHACMANSCCITRAVTRVHQPDSNPFENSLRNTRLLLIADLRCHGRIFQTRSQVCETNTFRSIFFLTLFNFFYQTGVKRRCLKIESFFYVSVAVDSRLFLITTFQMITKLIQRLCSWIQRTGWPTIFQVLAII